MYLLNNNNSMFDYTGLLSFKFVFGPGLNESALTLASKVPSTCCCKKVLCAYSEETKKRRLLL